MTKDRQECHGAANGDSSAPASRSFLGRAAAFLAGEAGLSQFLAVAVGTGSGAGTGPAGGTGPGGDLLEAAREARPDGTADFFQADLRDPGSVLGSAADTLDFGRPVGVLLRADADPDDGDIDPHRIIASLMNVLPGGSYLAVTARDEAEAARFLEGLSLVEPGVVPAQDWHRAPADPPAGDAPVPWAGVGRKPS